jgi:hypothetical protein
MLRKRLPAGPVGPESEIVEVVLARHSYGSVDRCAPFVVLSDDQCRDGLYVNEPAVIAKLAHDEDAAWFEATRDGEEWTFGRRVQDA